MLERKQIWEQQLTPSSGLMETKHFENNLVLREEKLCSFCLVDWHLLCGEQFACPAKEKKVW